VIPFETKTENRRDKETESDVGVFVRTRVIECKRIPHASR